MIFYIIKAIVSNFNDIRKTRNRRVYNPLFNKITVELYRESGYSNIVVLAKTKKRFEKVELAIVSKKMKFNGAHASALAEIFFQNAD